MDTANDKFLRDKENRIKLLFSSGAVPFVSTFDFLHKLYTHKNSSGKTPILPVFEAIYIKKIQLPAWKLAIYCNVSRSTLFNYRNTIVNDFNTYINENLITEIAYTKEEDK